MVNWFVPEKRKRVVLLRGCKNTTTKRFSENFYSIIAKKYNSCTQKMYVFWGVMQ